MFSWGRSVSPYLSVSDCACRTQPRDLGCQDAQCSACSSFPTQRREAGLVHASPRVHAQFLLLLSERSSPGQDCTFLLILTRLPLFPTQLFIQEVPQFYQLCRWRAPNGQLPAVFFSYFLKSDHSFNWPFLEPLGYASPELGSERLWVGWPLSKLAAASQSLSDVAFFNYKMLQCFSVLGMEEQRRWGLLYSSSFSVSSSKSSGLLRLSFLFN